MSGRTGLLPAPGLQPGVPQPAGPSREPSRLQSKDVLCCAAAPGSQSGVSWGGLGAERRQLRGSPGTKEVRVIDTAFRYLSFPFPPTPLQGLVLVSIPSVGVSQLQWTVSGVQVQHCPHLQAND